MILLTQASFDIFHAGHVNFLKRCRNIAGEKGQVIVALLTDESYAEYRGYQPASRYEDRKKVVESCRYVTRVIPSAPKKFREDIKKYQPNIIAIGTDWYEKDLYKQYDMTPEELDDKLVYIPRTRFISSSEIKKKIKNESK